MQKAQPTIATTAGRLTYDECISQALVCRDENVAYWMERARAITRPALRVTVDASGVLV